MIDADGWLHTGDLGVVGDDGNLRIVGRLKEMYIRGGYNVYPCEVEAVLADHPAVDRVAVVGGPDPVLGEIGVAFVVPVAGTATPTLDDAAGVVPGAHRRLQGTRPRRGARRAPAHLDAEDRQARARPRAPPTTEAR